MANLNNRLHSKLLMGYAQGKGKKRRGKKKSPHLHAKDSLKTYWQQTTAFARWLKNQGVKTRCSEEEAAQYIQAYIDYLVALGRKANTVHTALAALCKVFDRKMSDYEKPRRTAAPTKGRTDAPSLAGRADADCKNEKYRRLVEFVERVGIRREEYADLRGRDFVRIDGTVYVVVEQGKGGKKQHQKIEEADAAFIQSYFDGKGADEAVFSEAEMKNKLNLHAYRRKHAQEMYKKYVSQMAADPAYREQLKKELRVAFERAGEDWASNSDMQLLDKVYYCRGAVRRAMLEQGRPVAYDRLALMAVSVFHLAHWRAGVTVKNYMQ